MTEATATYWATLAQVIPIVALGVVVEARAVAAHWDLQTPTALKGTQSAIWALMLGVLALGESRAIAALRGESPEPYWSRLCEASIWYGMGILILAPALELVVKAYAFPLAGLLTAHPIYRWRLWRLDRKHRHLERKWAEGLQSFESALTTLESTLVRAQTLKQKQGSKLSVYDAATQGRALTSEEAAHRKTLLGISEEARAFTEETEELLSEARGRKQAMIDSMNKMRSEHRAKRSKHTAELREARTKQRLNFAGYLLDPRSAKLSNEQAEQQDAVRTQSD